MRRFALVGVVTLLLGFLGGAPVSAAPVPAAPAAPPPVVGAAGIGDPYFPQDGNGGYDVQHYRLAVRYEPRTDVLRGRATIKARALERLSRFDLDLVGLTVDSVRVDGHRAHWSRAGQELRITPSKPLRRGRTFTVKVRYHGVPKVLDEPSLGQAGVFPTADGALVVGEPHVAATWFPVNDHPSDKATYTVSITVPRGLEAVSNGRLTSIDKHRRTTTWTWQERAPMASYLATATVGQFALTSYRTKDVAYLDAIDAGLLKHPKPRTGRQFAASGADASAYKRLTRTFSVPSSGGTLSFYVQRNSEQGYDSFAVEAHPVGSDDWTTLPDLRGHTTPDPGYGCPYSLDLHPFLAHYLTATGGDDDPGCTPTGSTGSWNAASGASDGYEHWSVDLSPYAGQQVQVALSVITDDAVTYAGAYVDDISGPGGAGTTSFEADGSTLDGWSVSGPPAGSPAATGAWRATATDPVQTVGENAADALAKEPQAIAFLAGILGPYPFRDAGGIVDDDPGIGFALENQTRPIYSKTFFLEDVEENDSVVVHELAHQWTGDDLALERWKDIWLNEGFASYMEWLWSEKQGRGTADEIFAADSGIPADDPFWELKIGDPGPDALFDGAVYSRGAMTLHALRRTIGDDAFFTLLKSWTARYSGGNVTTAQFVALAEKVSGRQLDAFFQTWLYTPAKPAGLEQPSASRSTRSDRLAATPAARHGRPALRR